MSFLTWRSSFHAYLDPRVHYYFSYRLIHSQVLHFDMALQHSYTFQAHVRHKVKKETSFFLASCPIVPLHIF
ncbi:hypothetical protein FKM82_019910 [Ascaphus truei]